GAGEPGYVPFGDSAAGQPGDRGSGELVDEAAQGGDHLGDGGLFAVVDQRLCDRGGARIDGGWIDLPGTGTSGLGRRGRQEGDGLGLDPPHGVGGQDGGGVGGPGPTGPGRRPGQAELAQSGQGRLG